MQHDESRQRQHKGARLEPQTALASQGVRKAA